MKKTLIAMSGGVDSSLAAKPDSQDICFVPDGDYAGVIEKHTGRRPVCGNFVDSSGNVLGRHKGVIHYTIGRAAVRLRYLPEHERGRARQ